MKKNYSWGTLTYKQDPQKIGEYIEKLEKENELITPDLLVQKASHGGNVLHGMFDWDDSSAAHKYRKVQARNILGNIQVEIIEHDIENVRAFVNIHSEKSGYKSMSVVIANPEDWEFVMNEAKKDMQFFMEKYAKYKQVSLIVEEMQNLIES